MSYCKKYKLDGLGLPNSQNQYPCNKSSQVSVSDLNSISNCVSQILGQPSDSASSTDIYKLIMKTTYPNDYENFLYEGEYVNSIYMKIFVSELCLPSSVPYPVDIPDDLISRDELLYEYMLYLSKIKNFTKMGICPYFVKVLGGNLRVDYDDIQTFLKSITMLNQDNMQMSDDSKENVLERNMNVIIRRLADRPSITNTSIDIKDKLPTEIVKNYTKYGYFMTEGTSNTTNLSDAIMSGSLDLNEIYIVIFQLIAACRTMNLSKIAHNDLHLGNVLIERRNYNHTIISDDNIFTLLSPFVLHLYDFDRGYLEGYQNSLLRYDGLIDASQSNDLLEKRDLVKVMYYIFQLLPNPTFRENISEILIDVNLMANIGVTKTRILENFYDEAGPLLKADGGIRGSNFYYDFAIFNRSYEHMMYLAYDLIDAKYKNYTSICSVPFPTYYIRSDVFDDKGNIISQNLETLKSNYIKDICTDQLLTRIRELENINYDLINRLNQPQI